ncbi:MAG: globin [Gammaproteobacteria bacterium]|nr:globin [Gammaproteobacteria bacterium]
MDFIEEFKSSYERILGSSVGFKSDTAEPFFDYFYQCFLASSPEVANAFRNTNMDAQKQMLKRSLIYSVGFLASKESYAHMEKMARKHGRHNLNIPAPLYELWLDCMLAAVAKFDPKYDDDVELAWRLALAPAITYMKFMYDK